MPIYNYLSTFLKPRGYEFMVAADRVQSDNPHKIHFKYEEISLSFINILRCIQRNRVNIIILWVNLKYGYLFPVIWAAKFLKIKIIYWGHGRDLEDPDSNIKNIFYTLEHYLVDAIILYAGYLKKYMACPLFLQKTFVANNTLNFTGYALHRGSKADILKKFGIRTTKNIICIGRLEKRKRIPDLIAAFELIESEGVGLILIGSDSEGVMNGIQGENIYILGPVYGEDCLSLLSAADVYCLPGHVGLGIVDAFYCGLPVVTENTIHAPEIMYLKDGVNGFMVPVGNVEELASKIELLLHNDDLRAEFANAARKIITTHGTMEVMSRGFLEALDFVNPVSFMRR